MTILKKIIDDPSVGSVQTLADYFGISIKGVYKWGVQIPAERCPDIEGLVSHRILCEEMRPDVNWAVLREPIQVINSCDVDI